MFSRNLLFIILLMSVTIIPPAYAQLPQISSGLTYLTSSQNPDGTWGSGTELAETTAVTVSALETLQLLSQTAGTSYTTGASWLQGQSPQTVDYISERVHALSLADGSVNALIPSIDTLKGAWGGYVGFRTNPLDTALSLQALKAANYADQTTINPALANLTGIQNPDGGWGFVSGDDSNIYLTAIVSATLQQFPQMTPIATAVSKATNYLIAHQNPDGGFGESSTVYETALAYAALAAVSTNEAALTSAVNYLTTSQSTNGSWNDDPYSTALALKALYLSENRPAPPPPPPAAGKFTGSVLDATTLQGVSGVAVVLESSPLINTTTDAAGSFTLADVAPGSQKVAFSKSGYASTFISANSIADVTVSLGSVAMTSAYSTGTISGTILDSGGKPLGDVAIAVSGSWSGSAVTGVDGTFSFSFVTPGDVTISASKTGYQDFTGTGRVYARTTLSISPRLNTAPPQVTTGGIVGRVIDDLWGYPIDHLPEDQGVRVTISGGAYIEPDPDTGGKFAFSGLAPNTYQVTVGMNGFVSQTFRVIVAPGVTTDLGTIRLVMSAATMTLVGRISDAVTGMPIPGAEIYIPVTGQTARSDFAGSYTIADIKTFQFDVKISAPGYVAKTVDLYQTGIHGSIWTQTVDVALTPQATKGDLTGRVIDAQTGQPLAEAVVAGAGDPAVNTITGGDGVFTLPALAMGQQQVIVTLDGFTPRTVGGVIFPGQVNNAGDIPLSLTTQTAVIRGTVRNAVTGGPLAGVQVSAVGSGNLQAVTADDGSYTFSDVAPGVVTVDMTKTGYYPARISATLAAGGLLVYSPAMSGALPVTVSANIQTDKPVYSKGDTAGINVNLINRESRELAATMHLQIIAPDGATAYEAMLDAALAADGARTLSVSCPLPAMLQGGVYSVVAELFDSMGIWAGAASGSFGVAVSRITVTPDLPQLFSPGANTLLFNLANNGDLPVSAGLFTLVLKDPAGQTVAVAEQPFALATGEGKTLNLGLTVPPVTFGSYSLVYSQSDETRDGVPVTILLDNSVGITALFDSNSHRVRGTAALTVTLVNTGRFALDAALPVTVTVPDAAFAETKSLAGVSPSGSTLVYSFTIPATVTSGEHNAIVTAALPGGSSTTTGTKLVIFEAALSLAQLQNSHAAGETISPVITNSGGVDAPLLYRLSLYDANAKLIADKSNTETAVAGDSLSLALAIPPGAVDGSYNLVINYKNLTTGREEIVTPPLTISGVKGSLQVKTSKQSYLATESITGLSTVTNSGTPLQDGNLHLQVTTTAGSQQQKIWTSQADFQQGVRSGVDTYGVNDWIIPDDDFSETVIDTSKWTPNNNISIQNGRLFVDTTQTPNSSSVLSKWLLEGDFDIQVDFMANNNGNWVGAQLSIVVSDTSWGSWVTIGNYKANGYTSHIAVNGALESYVSGGGSSTSGKFRITRTGNKIVNYYWGGTSWNPLYGTSSLPAIPCYVGMSIYRDPAHPGANVAFDNFKVNSGLIKTENQTVDSVRLLPVNDNFDDADLSAERWSVRGSGSVAINEINGSLVTADTQTGVQSYAHAAGRFPLEGDFDVSIDWKTPVAPATGEWSSVFQISEVDQNTAHDNNLVGNALQIRRAYINGLGHIYQTGHYNGTAWDSWSGLVNTTDTAGRFRIKRAGSSVTVWYWNSSLNRWEWDGNTEGYTWSSAWTTSSYVQIGAVNNLPDRPAVETDWNNFKAGSSAMYAAKGTILLRQDAGQTSNWQTISWNATQPIGTSIKLRSRTAAEKAGLTASPWSEYISASGSSITSPPGRWIEIEATLETTDTKITSLLHDVTVTYGHNSGDILWQADVPVNLTQGALAEINSAIGTLETAGKFYLQGTLSSSTGQTVATTEYPFYVVQGNMIVSLGPDKKLYKPGETVTISGEVTNLATAEAANLLLTVKAKAGAGAEQSLYTDTFTIPAGGSRPFSVTTTAGPDGVVTLSATVVQNAAALAAIADQFEVASPKVAASLSGPDEAGVEPVTMTLTIVNSGKTDAAINIATSFGSPAETITVAAGQTRILQYQQKLTASTTFTITLSGDLTQQLTKTITYAAPRLPATLSAKLVTDKIAYSSGEKVALTATITCLDAGTTGDTLAGKVLIVNSSGEALFTDAISLPLPDTGRLYTNSKYWDSAVYPPGTYTARVVVNGGGVALATGETTFTILPSSATAAGVVGTLSAAVNQVYLGIDQSIAVALFNDGNEELTGATCSVTVVNPDTGAIMQTYSKVVDIPCQGTAADTVVVPTGSMEERDYLAVLRITLPGMAQAKTLAGAAFSVKIAPPPSLLLSTLSNGAVTNNQTLNVTGSATGVVAIKSITINGAEVPFNSDGSFSHALLLEQGINPVTTTVTDVLEHSASDTREITLDQKAPILTITSPSDNSKTAISPVEVKGSVDETSTVTIKVKENIQSATMNGAEFSATVIPEPGWNTIEITARDLADNPSSQKRTLLFDDQKPSLTISEPPQDIRTNKNSLTISGTASDPVTAVGVTVTADGTILSPPVIGGIFSQVVTFTDEKLYPITVIATNEVGTRTTVQRNVIYDKTPPNLTIDPVVTPTNSSGQIVTGTREEGTLVTITCVTATIGTPEYPDPVSWRVPLSGMQQGENRLQASATDLANNRTTATATILYVPRAPDVTISTSQNQLWPPNKELVPVTISGNVVTYGSDIRDATISVADEYGKQNQQGMKFGDTLLLEAWRDGKDLDGRVYTITAVVTDQAGNRTTRSTTVVVPHDMGK